MVSKRLLISSFLVIAATRPRLGAALSAAPGDEAPLLGAPRGTDRDDGRRWL